MSDYVDARASGCNCVVNGEHGYVSGLLTEGPHVVGAFIAVPPEHHTSGEPVRVMHATLGRHVGVKREVVSARFITRDEFDRLTTLDKLRRDLGWREWPREDA